MQRQTNLAPGRTCTRHYLPLAVDLSGKSCLVIGGGPVGTRKALTLAQAGARVTVLSPRISAGIREALGQRRVQSTLEQMPALAQQAAVGSPALLVVGCAASELPGGPGSLSRLPALVEGHLAAGS